VKEPTDETVPPRTQIDPPGGGKWNIITILTDDQAAWAVRAYGNEEAFTPNMDRLAQEGALFTNAFAASGVCTPSRVAYLTGVYPIQAGMPDVPYRRDPDEGLPLGLPTWPRVLKANGYVTGLIGKWHLGRTWENYPTNYGIDYFFGFLRGSTYPMDPVLTREGESGVFPGPTPDILVDDTIRFLEEHQSDPFALMLHFRAPHAPHLPVPEADLKPFESIEIDVPMVDPELATLDDDQEPADPSAIALHEKLLREKLRTYYASVHSVDRNLGRLFDKLDELKLADRTIVLFTSDQGYLFGHRGLKGKGGAQPVRNHTLAEDIFVVNLFDHTLKVPLLVRWPGVVEAGLVIDELVSNIDTFATVLGMLGIPIPKDCPQTGMDFSPLLRGEKIPWRDAIFAEYTPDQIGQIEFIRMVRTQRWKLVRTYLNSGGNQLFDLENDPEEMNNLYYLDNRSVEREEDPIESSRVPHPYAEILSRLQEQLTEWQLSIDDPALKLDSIYLEAKKERRARWSQR
jgi:uncharacterized sulfatase